jgi:hypothetical protein
MPKKPTQSEKSVVHAQARSARQVKPTPLSGDDLIIPDGTAVSLQRATDTATSRSPPFTADNMSAIRTPASTMTPGGGRGGGGHPENLADLTSCSFLSSREATPMTSVPASILKKRFL